MGAVVSGRSVRLRFALLRLGWAARQIDSTVDNICIPHPSCALG